MISLVRAHTTVRVPQSGHDGMVKINRKTSPPSVRGTTVRTTLLIVDVMMRTMRTMKRKSSRGCVQSTAGSTTLFTVGVMTRTMIWTDLGPDSRGQQTTVPTTLPTTEGITEEMILLILAHVPVRILLYMTADITAIIALPSQLEVRASMSIHIVVEITSGRIPRVPVHTAALGLLRITVEIVILLVRGQTHPRALQPTHLMAEQPQSLR